MTFEIVLPHLEFETIVRSKKPRHDGRSRIFDQINLIETSLRATILDQEILPMDHHDHWSHLSVVVPVLFSWTVRRRERIPDNNQFHVVESSHVQSFHHSMHRVHSKAKYRWHWFRLYFHWWVSPIDEEDWFRILEERRSMKITEDQTILPRSPGSFSCDRMFLILIGVQLRVARARRWRK